jgi:hypothetical protein
MLVSIIIFFLKAGQILVTLNELIHIQIHAKEQNKMAAFSFVYT